MERLHGYSSFSTQRRVPSGRYARPRTLDAGTRGPVLLPANASALLIMTCPDCHSPEKMAALLTLDYLRREAALGSREDFERVLKKVPDVPPEPYDEMPKG